jgi:hypothetical protein
VIAARSSVAYQLTQPFRIEAVEREIRHETAASMRNGCVS